VIFFSGLIEAILNKMKYDARLFIAPNENFVKLFEVDD